MAVLFKLANNGLTFFLKSSMYMFILLPNLPKIFCAIGLCSAVVIFLGILIIILSIELKIIASPFFNYSSLITLPYLTNSLSTCYDICKGPGIRTNAKEIAPNK